MQPFQLQRIPISECDYDILIDARSPKEYAEDHILGAINLPVLDDQQHKEVGTIYHKDAFQASRVGAALISENIAHYLKNDLAELDHTTKILFYCWRGNHRSKAFAHVVKSVGWNASVIEGGYKTYRSHVLESLKAFFSHPDLQLRVISGNTGSGKTKLLQSAKQHGLQIIDLEELANHKGSLFGADPSQAQPTQKKFETLLYQQTQQLDITKPIYLEAESSKIGSIFCSPPLWQAMKAAPVIELNIPMEQRVHLILSDYQHFLQNPDTIRKPLLALQRIRGKKTVATWLEYMDAGNWSALVESLLRDHYDLSYQSAGAELSPFQNPYKKITINDFNPNSIQSAISQLSHA